MSAPRARRRRAAATAAGVLALALTAAACSGTAEGDKDGDNPSGAPKAAYELTATTPAPSGDIDSFTWSLYAEPFTLAFPYAYDYPPNTVLSNVCESLLRLNPDLSISPGLAEKYENPDPTTWVYTIRQGVTFHDGSPLTADDVVASLSFHLNPAFGSYWTQIFANVKSIEKTGADQVTVKLKQPDSMFNQYMAITPGTIESAKTLATMGADYGNASNGVNCTGPYAFDSWTPGDNITLKKYAGYWDPELMAKADTVKFVFLSDPSTRVNAWTSGEVDGGWQVPANAYTQLQNGGPGTLYYGLNTATASEIVNKLDGPLGDPKVRQALLMAIDREGVVQAAEQGIGEVATSQITASTWGGLSADEVKANEADLPAYDYDPEAAKKLAAEAGVDGQKITIATTPAFQAADIIATAVADAAKTIGLDPKIETVSPDKYGLLFGDPKARAKYDMFMTYWYNSLADPMDYFGALRTGIFANYGGWSNPEFDAAAAKAIATPVDDPSRLDSLRQMDKITMDQLPWIPIYSAPASVWMGDRISGVSPSINYLYYPWAATIGAK